MSELCIDSGTLASNLVCVCVCACVSKSGALEVEAHLGQEFKAHDEEILQVICDDIFLCLSL